jgi:uncharacterized protein YmfQ (DUF2313 family)
VIDSNWKECIDLDTLQALQHITGLKKYKKILKKYEGYTIEELLDNIKIKVK